MYSVGYKAVGPSFVVSQHVVRGEVIIGDTSHRRGCMDNHFRSQAISHKIACLSPLHESRELSMIHPQPVVAVGATALSIVHHTSGLLFVDKPPGFGFHHEEEGSPGVLPMLRDMQRRGELEFSGRLFSVHRLDRVTSGLLMVAKSAAAAREASELLRDRRLHKYYVALSARKPAKKMGRVSGDMERSRRGQWKLLRSLENPAVTVFTSEALTQDATEEGPTGQPLRAFVLKPLTGRTHQLRVAMKCLGSPVLGDTLYAAADDAKREERAYLHSAALRIPAGCMHLSDDGAPIEVVCTPTIGSKFTSAAFASTWARWFSEAADHQGASLGRTWFESTPVASELSLGARL